MDGLLAELSARGAAAILAVQAHATPALDLIAVAITLLGQEPFFALLYAVSFWCWGKREGLRATGLIVLTLIVNEAIKRAVAEPRPFVTYPEIVPGIVVASASFPSGHAQTSATFWFAAGVRVRKPWFWAASAVMVTLIALSRVYLGVHYPHDVIAGIFVGVGVAGLWWAILRAARAWVRPEWRMRAAIVGVATLMIALFLLRQRQVAVGLGAALGAASGWLLEERRPGTRPAPGRSRCIARVALGAAPLGVTAWLALRGIPSDRMIGQSLVDAALGAASALAITWGVPRLLARAGLMLPGSPAAPSTERNAS